jgi:hypothetical protein
MQMPFFLFGFAAVLSTAALGEDDCRCWTPDAQQVAAAEAIIASRPRQLPLGSLDRYVRYYAGVIIHDSRFIRGKLVPASGDDVPGVHIVEGRMPLLQGDGCVTYSEPGRGRVYLKCARFDAWTPSEGQIAELERLLRLPIGQGDLSVLRDYAGYARHYAGVIKDDRRVVVGVFVSPRLLGETAGIYIGSDAELPETADGGCGVIAVQYDPSTKEVEGWCNGAT